MAAPKMVLASRVRNLFISFKTRAVIPTLVADNVAAKNKSVLSEPSGISNNVTIKPSNIGTKMPNNATRIDSFPVCIISSMDVSKPTINKRKITP